MSGKIIAKVQERQRRVASNALEVHISNLRKKLPKDFIKTLRGVGYSVSVNPS